jgi:hypothetical protein
MDYILSSAAPATRTIYHHSRFLVEFRQAIAWSMPQEPAGWIMSRSYLYLCPTCGKLWAMSPLKLFSGVSVPFTSVWGICEACGGSESFLANSFGECVHDFALFEALPHKLMSRELNLL